MGVEDEPRDERGRWTAGSGAPVPPMDRALAELMPPASAPAGDEILKDAEVEGQQAVASADTWASTLNARELSPEQGRAMREWTRVEAYTAVNGALRSGGDVSPGLQTQIANMDTAIAAQGLTAEPTTLYRSVSGDVAQEYGSADVSERFTDPGYAATTPNLVTAAKFSAVAQRSGGVGYEGAPQILEIRAPAGTQGFAMGAWNPSPTFNETTLPRGSEFEVLEQHPPTTLESANWSVPVPARTVVALR